MRADSASNTAHGKKSPCPTLFPWELARLLRSGEDVALVDVRKARMFAKGHLPGALSAPFDQMGIDQLVERLPNKDQPVVVYCYVGVLSKDYARALTQLGYARAYSLTWGFPTCKLWVR